MGRKKSPSCYLQGRIRFVQLIFTIAFVLLAGPFSCSAQLSLSSSGRSARSSEHHSSETHHQHRARALAAPIGPNAIEFDGEMKTYFKVPGGFQNGVQKAVFDETQASAGIPPDFPDHSDRNEAGFNAYEDNTIFESRNEAQLWVPPPYRNETTGEKGASEAASPPPAPSPRPIELEQPTVAETTPPSTTHRSLVASELNSHAPIPVRTTPAAPVVRPAQPFGRGPAQTLHVAPQSQPLSTAAPSPPPSPPTTTPPPTTAAPVHHRPAPTHAPPPPPPPPPTPRPVLSVNVPSPPPRRPFVPPPVHPGVVRPPQLRPAGRPLVAQPPPPVRTSPPPPPTQRTTRPTPQSPRPPPSRQNQNTNFNNQHPKNAAALRTGVCHNTIYYQTTLAGTFELHQVFSHFAVVVSVDQCARTCHEFNCAVALFDPRRRHCQFNPSTAFSLSQGCPQWPNPLYRNNIPIGPQPFKISCVTCQQRRRNNRIINHSVSNRFFNGQLPPQRQSVQRHPAPFNFRTTNHNRFDQRVANAALMHGVPLEHSIKKAIVVDERLGRDRQEIDSEWRSLEELDSSPSALSTARTTIVPPKSSRGEGQLSPLLSSLHIRPLAIKKSWLGSGEVADSSTSSFRRSKRMDQSEHAPNGSGSTEVEGVESEDEAEPAPPSGKASRNTKGVRINRQEEQSRSLLELPSN